MKSTFVVDLSPGDDICELFAIRKVDLREYSGGKMISLELVDRSGRINGVVWNSARELIKTLVPGGVYKIEGSVTTYKGESQLTVNRIEPQTEYDPEDFVPRGPYLYDQLDERLTLAIGEIVDSHYRELLDIIFSDGRLRRSFLQGVGGKLWHHNYIGGLAEHSLSVFDLCLDFSNRYEELEKDLILTGALLHDIGKVQSYSMANAIEYTDSGRLLGHIVIGDRMVTEAIVSVPGFPEEKELKLRHLILSHQGSPEQSSPVPPMTSEGMALYIADLLDSKLSALRRIEKKENRPGVKWSNFARLLDRHIYFGSKGDKDEEVG